MMSILVLFLFTKEQERRNKKMNEMVVFGYHITQNIWVMGDELDTLNALP